MSVDSTRASGRSTSGTSSSVALAVLVAPGTSKRNDQVMENWKFTAR